MELADFINENREELTAAILNAVPNNPEIDDDEIEMWIINDESLTNFAIESGVEL